MNSQTLTEVLYALSQPEVYSWIISVIGATLTSFIPEKDENKKEITLTPSNQLLAITFGTLVAKFGTVLLINNIDVIKPAPALAYFIAGLIGNALSQFFIKLFRKVSSDSNVDLLYDIFKNYLIKKFKPKE